LSARYWSEAAKEKRDPSGLFYYWNGERSLDPNAPQLHGTGEARLESADRARGYWTTHADKNARLIGRTSGVYLRAEAADVQILDGPDDRRRTKLISDSLKRWKVMKSA